MTKDNAHTYQTADDDVEGFEIHLQLNGGLFQQDSNGVVKDWAVTYKVEYKITGNGGWVDLGSTTITAKSRTTVRRVFRKIGLTAGQFDIRVTRTSDDSSLDPYMQGDLTWVQIDEIKTDDYSYPGIVLLGIEALATEQLSGSMPNFTCIADVKKNLPKVMNGAAEVDWEDYYWDPDAELYKLLADDTELSWDDTTFVDKYNANPIWFMKDLFINDEYGLGEFIASTVIDDDLFLEMSRYCEERVPDGEGGYEKRFRLDAVLDSPTKAFDVITQLCATFRGMPFYSDGVIKLAIDKPETPVQLFTMGNIIEDSFAQNWKSKREVPNVLNVQILDKDKDYEQETYPYMDEDALIAGDPMRKKDVKIFVTRLSQAIREARYGLKVAKYLRRGVSFKAGIDAIACQPGQLISVSHDVPQWGFSGRVQSGSTTTKVVVDQDLTIEDGKTYKIIVQFADDTIEERTVDNVPGTAMDITVSSVFSQTPAAYDKYSFGESNKVKKDFRVISIKRDNRSEAEISVLEYDENVYDDSPITKPTSNYSSLDLSVPNVSDLKLTERLVKLPDGTIENAIDVWFDKPTQGNYVRRFAKAKIYISEDNSNWHFRGETTGIHYSIIGDIASGVTYYVKVVTITDMGQEGSFTNSPSDQIAVIGKAAPPSDITTFLVNQNRDRIFFGWSEISDLDIWGYEIRWGSSWDSGMVVAFVQGDHYLTTDLRTGVSQKYWIKAIDTSGNYSENAKDATITIDNIPFRNIIEEYSEQTAWAGDKTDTEVDGDNLIISAGELSGTYETPVRDVGYVATFYIGIEVVASISQGRAFDDDGTTKFNTFPTLRFTGMEAPGAATFQINTSEDNIVWSGWKDYQAGDYKCRYFKIIMTLTRENVSDALNCSTFDYYSDLPDIDEIQDGEVTVAASGDDITFAKTFHEDPALNITILTGDGVFWLATGLDTTDVNIKLYDEGGVIKTGTFRIHIHGI